MFALKWLNLILLYVVIIAFCGNSQGADLLSFTPERIVQMRKSPQYSELIRQADRMLSVHAITTDDPRIKEKTAREARKVTHRVGRQLASWMEYLGFAWKISGDQKYVSQGKDLLCQMAKNHPITSHWMSGKGTMAGGRGDFMRGLAMGYGFFADQMTQEQRDLVADCAKGYLDHFIAESGDPKCWYRGPHNFNGVCGGAAGLLTLTFTEYPEIAVYRKNCADIIENWFSAGFGSEGAYYEGVTYSQYGLSNSLLFAWFLKKETGRDLFKNPRMAKVSRFYAMSMIPGTDLMDARNDSTYVTPDLTSLILAAANKDGVAAWLWSRSDSKHFPWNFFFEGELPKITSPEEVLPKETIFPDRGLYIWRTGWGKNDVMFSTEAGPFYPITHNQADKGHFTFYSQGHFWAVDPGYGNDNYRPKSRCQTDAHNCVLIDGQGQASSGTGTGTNGKIVKHSSDSQTGYALIDATEAYQKNVSNRPGVGAQKAFRHNLLIRPHDDSPAYAMIFDDIQKDDRPHQFTWQMLTAEENHFELSAQGIKVIPGPWQKSFDYVQSESNGKQGSCHWEFETKENAEWFAYGLVAAMGENASSSDSFFIKIDDQPKRDWHCGSLAQWSWLPVVRGAVERELLRISLPAGKHRLTISSREPDAALGGIILTRRAFSDFRFESLKNDDIILPVLKGKIGGAMKKLTWNSEGAFMMLAVNASAETDNPLVDLYVPDDGRKPKIFPRVKISTQTVNPCFAAALIPLSKEGADPKITFIRSEGGKTVKVSVQWETHCDFVRWTVGKEPKFSRSETGK